MPWTCLVLIETCSLCLNSSWLGQSLHKLVSTSQLPFATTPIQNVLKWFCSQTFSVHLKVNILEIITDGYIWFGFCSPVISREKGAWAIFLTQAWSPFQTFCCCINFPPWTQHQPTLSQGLLLVKCSASNLNSVLSLWHRFSSVLGSFIQLNLKSKASSQYSIHVDCAPIVVLPVFVPPASKYLFAHARDTLHSDMTQSWEVFLIERWISS